MKKFLLPIILLILYGCGTTQSLQEVNYVPYAEVTVSSSLTVQGLLINETDSTVSISADGAYVTYNLEDIVRYKKVMRPDQIEMQQDIVNNTNAAAGNTAFFVVLTLYLFGGEIINGFSFTLLVGIIVGTYSSIFIAASFLVQLNFSIENYRNAEAEKEKRQKEKDRIRAQFEQGMV